MNDFNFLKSTLYFLKIPFIEREEIEQVTIKKTFIKGKGWDSETVQGKYHITLDQGFGYAGFAIDFDFDENGKFLSYSIYE